MITFIEKTDKGKQHHDINLLNSSMEIRALFFHICSAYIFGAVVLSVCASVRFHVNDIRRLDAEKKWASIESIFVNRTAYVKCRNVDFFFLMRKQKLYIISIYHNSLIKFFLNVDFQRKSLSSLKSFDAFNSDTTFSIDSMGEIEKNGFRTWIDLKAVPFDFRPN